MSHHKIEEGIYWTVLQWNCRVYSFHSSESCDEMLLDEVGRTPVLVLDAADGHTHAVQNCNHCQDNDLHLHTVQDGCGNKMALECIDHYLAVAAAAAAAAVAFVVQYTEDVID